MDAYVQPELLLVGNFVYLKNNTRFDFVGEIFPSLSPVAEEPLDLTRSEVTQLVFLNLARHFSLQIDYRVANDLPQGIAFAGDLFTSVYLRRDPEITNQLFVVYHRTDEQRSIPINEETYRSMPLADFLTFFKRKWIKNY